MKNRFFLTAFTILLFSHNALAGNQRLCDSLHEYLRATPKSDSLRVKLINDWPNFSKQCLFFDSSAAEVFCKSLIANTSTEFMKLNLTSILSCANADISFENLSIDELSGSLTVYEIPKVNENIEMTLRFSFGYSHMNDFTEISTLYDKLD